MEVTYFLKQFSLFRSLSVDTIRNYFESAGKASFDAGDVIVDFNDSLDHLYVILEGSVSVYLKDINYNDYKVNTLKPGNTFGEMTLLTDDSQPFMIKANEGLKVIKLEKSKFDELLQQHPSINKKFYKGIVRRLHHMYSKKEEKTGEITQNAFANRGSESILLRKEKELLFLDKVHQIIASNKPFKVKLSKITEGIADFYDIGLCLLYLYEKDDRHIKLYAANDFKNVYASSYRLNQSDDIIRWVKENKNTLSISDIKGGSANVMDDSFDSDQINLKQFSQSKFLVAHNFKRLLFVPLIEDKKVVGLLALLSRKEREYSDEDKRFLEIITGNFIGIIRKEQFDYEAALRTVELDTLKKISEAMQTKASIKELLDHILENTLSAMNAKRCTLKLSDPLSGTIKIESTTGFKDGEHKVVKKGIEKHLKETVLNIGEYVIINDTSKIERFSDGAKELVSSLVSVPFQLHDKVIGMITVYDKKEDAFINTFDQNDLRLLTAIATHTSIMIENARLYDELAYSQSGAKVQLKVATEILGKSFKAKLVNDKIKKASQNTEPALILGEVGIGKNFVARCIHFSSNRMAYHFVTEDCRNFADKVHGSDLFGSKAKDATEEDVRGILELSHDGTLALRHVEELSREVQERLCEYLKTKKYQKVNGKRIRTSDVKILFQSNVDIVKLVENEQFNPELYEIISRQTIKLPPLRDRKKDMPLIIDHFLKTINQKLQKNVTHISDSSMGMLMSYDWPGNLMELYNVLERGVLVASQDTILSEQIFLGIPRAEGKKTYNLLRFNWINKLLKSRLYPGVFQVLSALTFFAIVYFSFFSDATGEKNIAVILSWIIGWPLLFISYLFLGRIFCTVCPFSSISKFVQRFVNLGYKMPDKLKKHGNFIAVTFCFVILWFEEVTNIYVSPGITGFLVLFIFSLALLTSILYERMVWCRYLCPWGILNGIFSMASVMELRSNRHVCLTQCKTNVCFEGSENVPGCPMFEHPYGMESNKNCTLCGNCIKNCPNNSIQLNLRSAAKELWVKLHPRLSDSVLSISLAFLFLLKIVLDGKTVNNFIFSGYGRYSLYGGLIYTALFLLTILLSAGFLKLINYGAVVPENRAKSRITESIGYAFIPLALTGYLSYYLEPLLLKGRALYYALRELLFDIPFDIAVTPIISHITIKNFQVVIILLGGIASIYSSYKIISSKLAKLNIEEVTFYKTPVIWVIITLMVSYLILI
jgi:transcriptional regulator with GAF, ATPase, and Fis domain/polyferredoxin